MKREPWYIFVPGDPEADTSTGVRQRCYYCRRQLPKYEPSLIVDEHVFCLDPGCLVEAWLSAAEKDQSRPAPTYPKERLTDATRED